METIGEIFYLNSARIPCGLARGMNCRPFELVVDIYTKPS